MPRLMEGTTLRILVAEDDRSIASVLKRRLEAAHYSVDVCHDGGAAYDLLRLTDYDVAIIDCSPTMKRLAFNAYLAAADSGMVVIPV